MASNQSAEAVAEAVSSFVLKTRPIQLLLKDQQVLDQRPSSPDISPEFSALIEEEKRSLFGSTSPDLEQFQRVHHHHHGSKVEQRPSHGFLDGNRNLVPAEILPMFFAKLKAQFELSAVASSSASSLVSEVKLPLLIDRSATPKLLPLPPELTRRPDMGKKANQGLALDELEVASMPELKMFGTKATTRLMDLNSLRANSVLMALRAYQTRLALLTKVSKGVKGQSHGLFFRNLFEVCSLSNFFSLNLNMEMRCTIAASERVRRD